MFACTCEEGAKYARHPMFTYEIAYSGQINIFLFLSNALVFEAILLFCVYFLFFCFGTVLFWFPCGETFAGH